MPLFHFLIASAFLAFLGACSSEPGNSNDRASILPVPGDDGGSAGLAERNVTDSKSAAHAGKAGHASANRMVAQRSGDENAGAPVDGTDSPEATGMTDVPPSSEAALPQSCDLDETCISKCEDNAVTCGVESTGVFCEVEGFIGATAQVACGQRAVIGTACCGGCGCVPVEVFFDGKHCWQGIPECKAEDLANRMFFPHPATTPNASYTPPGKVSGSFYLGTAGIGGSGGAADREAAGGSGGAADREAAGGSAGTSRSNAGAGGNAGTSRSNAGAGGESGSASASSNAGAGGESGSAGASSSNAGTGG